LLFGINPLAFSQELSQPQVIQNTKKGVVSISNKLIASVYSNDTTKELFGTGFIVDKKQGLIVTNEHLASKKRISEYRVTFFNGRETEAYFLYSDPWVDFAVLKVKPEDIPTEASQLEFSFDKIAPEDNVLIIGNNEGNNYSIQTGMISNTYETWGPFPFQNVIISLNTKGGSSGSPILNSKGKVVALNFAGDQTYAVAIPIAYINDALQSIKQNKIPPRHDIGAMLDYYSLDKAVIFSNFPKNQIDSYIKKHPNSFSKALHVTMVFEDSPAYKLLHPGDIIWKINSTEIGPELYSYQKMLNMSLGDKISMEVYREGKLEKIEIPLYDIHRAQLNRIIMFGGATFIEVDDYLRLLTGAPKGSVFITNVLPGSSFDVVPWVNVTDFGPVYLINTISIDNTPINNLDDLVKKIPTLVKKKDFKMNFKNYGFYQGFGGAPYLTRSEREVEIKYNSPDAEPTLMYYNSKKLEWVSVKIVSK
jgi:S1-C subfamily serine protease